MEIDSVIGEIAGALLRASPSPPSLAELLRNVLDATARSPQLGLVARGALFLADGDDGLVLVADHGLDPDRLVGCRSLRFGRCVCGEAARDRHVVLGSPATSTGGSPAEGVVSMPLLDGQTLVGVVVIEVAATTRLDDTRRRLLADVSHIVSLVVSRHILETVVDFRDFEIRLMQTDTVRLLGLAEECRDLDTGLHVLRVAHYCKAIAEAISLDDEETELIFQAAPMHDIGKIGIPDAILRNPGRLSDAEFSEMKAHTLIGEKILRGDGDLVSAARIVAGSHHERWDGTGYPRGLKGTDIPVFGRICAVADTFDALSTSRPYKDPWRLEDIVEHIERESGKQFDPEVVDAFFRALPEIVKFREVYGDEILLRSPPTHLVPFRETEHKIFPWKDEYSSGIHSIDMHHKYLFELTNKLAESLAGGCRIHEVAGAYKALESYTKIHFREEERLMESCGYADLEPHRREHATFIATLDQNWAKMRCNPLLVGHKILDFLTGWLINHIIESDGRAARVVLALEAIPRQHVEVPSCSNSGANRHGQEKTTLSLDNWRKRVTVH